MALFLFISSIYNARFGSLVGPSLDFSSLEFYCVSIEHNVSDHQTLKYLIDVPRSAHS